MKGLIATGGTGGHIAPAIALRDYMAMKGIKVKISSDMRGQRVFSGFLPDFVVDAYPLHSKKFIFNVLGIIKSIFYIKKYKPHFVIITGGYATFPVALATIFMRIPLFIIEANSLPGTITKIFARFAKLTFFAFSPVSQFRYSFKVTGLPIRKEIIKLKDNTKQQRRDTILIAGGSLGAESLIKVAFNISSHFPDEKFILIRGNKKNNVDKKPENLHVIDFCKDMVSLYKKVKIAITRAGGSFLSELLYLGIPSIVVPYPHAKDNHQWYNAKFFAKTGLGVMLEESELDRVKSVLEFIISGYKNFKVKKEYEYYHLNPATMIIKEINKYVR